MVTLSNHFFHHFVCVWIIFIFLLFSRFCNILFNTRIKTLCEWFLFYFILCARLTSILTAIILFAWECEEQTPIKTRCIYIATIWFFHFCKQSMKCNVRVAIGNKELLTCSMKSKRTHRWQTKKNFLCLFC